MNQKRGWLMALAVVALLLVACGPQMATPTPRAEPEDVEPQPTQTARVEPAPTGITPQAPPPDYSELPVDADDWRTFGSLDAPVTIVEYSDFQ